MIGRIRTKNAGLPQSCWAAISFALLVAVCLTASAQDQPAGQAPSTFQETNDADGDERSNLGILGRRLEAQKLQLEAEQKALMEQQKAAQKQAAQMQQMMQMMQQQGLRPPLPEDAEVRIFHLRNSRATAMIPVLQKILGDGLRIGADERSNSVVISADEKTAKHVEAMLMNLDAPSGEVESGGSLDTLQLRIVWLLDGVDGKEPAHGIDVGGGKETEGIVNSDVVDALTLLGFDAPKVVCQQVATITIEKERGSGQAQFRVPVLINGKLWQLSGEGIVRASAEDRFAVQFEVEYVPIIMSKPDVPHMSELAGSIYTPLRHFTVLGTTTFVEPPEVNEDGHVGKQPQQHLSAFVVYLDRAQEFPADLAPGQ